MTNNKLKFFIGSLVCFMSIINNQASGQIHIPHLSENKLLTLAEDQYQQGQYSNAAHSVSAYIEQRKTREHHHDLEKAKFILTISALKLDRLSAVDSAIVFISATPDPAYQQRTAYALAQYFFQHGQLAEAIPYYEMAGIANLSNLEIANAKFELAYCYFNNREFEKARPLFASIREYRSSYNIAGNYYFGLLAYNEGNYKEALKSFEKIENEKQYRTVVPYYIAEIHYFTGNRKKALEDALRLIKRSEKSFYHNELHLLAAQVLFEDQRYGEALPYFEQYYNAVDKIRKEDLYEMAYSYYRVNEWKNAIDKFKPLSNTRDSLGQTAMYLLGDCYLKVGDKKSARNAFSICADMPFNPGQQEASLLLAAKLSYEMGYYDAAVTYINTLISNFPGSEYKDEANTLLSGLLIKTSNYEGAYTALRDVKGEGNSYRAIRQKVTYGYALQQLRAGQLAEADELLSESLRNAVDPTYEAAANFWKGDIAYKMRQFPDVVMYTQKFLNRGAQRRDVETLSPSATIQNAYLNMGYASMELQDFEAAQSYFNRAQQARSDDPSFALNATLREADAVFMQKEYTKALALYNKVAEANGDDADYARFQKAVILGLMGNAAEKTNVLQTLISRTPPSAYANQARYEMALVYIETNKYQQAIDILTPLTRTSERSNMAPKALMKIGFAQQQINNDEKAIEAFRSVVTDYLSSEERTAALEALKSLYIENNQPSAYAKLLSDNNISTDDNVLDSTFYAAAESQFAAGKWTNAHQALDKYLQKYPNGAFANKAHYYKAESHFQLKEYKAALADYDAVLNNTWSDFTGNSARKAAAIALQANDNAAAVKYYGLLRDNSMNKETLQQAYNGLMQASFNLNNHKEAAAFADTLISIPGLEQGAIDNALLYKAKSLHQTDDKAQAESIYKQLQSSPLAPIAAESRYHIAELYFEQGKYKEAEEAAGSAIKVSGGNDFWVVRSYILLADIMTKQKDYFNAKATLQSIIKNTKITELKQEATRKLEHVKSLEKKQSKLSEE